MRDVAEHLREVVRVAVSRLAGFSDAQVRANPYPPKWSKIQVLGHLIDSACNNQQKFVRVMELSVGRGGESNLVFPGYAQNHWVDVQGYQDAQWSALVKLFELYNMHLAFVIERVRPELLANTITIEGPKGPAGPFTLEFIMRDYVEHMKHHLLQIDAGLGGMGVKSGFENVYGA